MKLWEQHLIESNHFSKVAINITESQIIHEAKLDILVKTLERLHGIKRWILEKLGKLASRLKILERLKKLETTVVSKKEAIAKEMAKIKEEEAKLRKMGKSTTSQIEEITQLIKNIKKGINDLATGNIKPYTEPIGKLKMVNPRLNR